MPVYPWQSALMKKISDGRARLPHAILLYGNSGIGKYDFARQLAQSLLCLSPASNGEPCGTCSSCGWYLQDNHPDFRLLSPEQDTDDEQDAGTAKKSPRKTQISVAQVRELGGFLELSSHQSDGLRIVLIHPAEALNAASANGLLKMLEEPPAGVVFILVSHQINRLLPTIISRCQKIDMPFPEREVALSWLKQQGQENAEQLLDYAGGAPLNVVRNVDQNATAENAALFLQGGRLDPFLAASKSASQGMEIALDALQKWIYDLLLSSLTGQVRYYNQHATALQAMAKSVDLSLLLDFQRQLNEARRNANHPLNNELQLETIFLTYTQLFMKKAG
jgi:DNA polymerase-3 subunit delta'